MCHKILQDILAAYPPTPGSNGDPHSPSHLTTISKLYKSHSPTGQYCAHTPQVARAVVKSQPKHTFNTPKEFSLKQFRNNYDFAFIKNHPDQKLLGKKDKEACWVAVFMMKFEQFEDEDMGFVSNVSRRVTRVVT